MTLFLALLLIPSFAPITAGATEGRQDTGADLYAKMSKAIDDAPALKGDFRGKVEGAGRSLTVDGSIRLKAPNRMKLDVTIADGKQNRPMSLICDGAQALDRTGGDPVAATEAPLDLVARFRGGLKSLGHAGLLLLGTPVKYSPRLRNDLPDFAAGITAGSFALRADERMEGKDARVVEYVATVKDGAAWKVRLWIDAQTFFPLKREIEGTWAGAPLKIVETTSFATTDLKDEEFALPAK